MNIIHVSTEQQLEQCLNIRKKVFVQEQQVDIAIEVDEFDRSPDACHHVLLTVNGEAAATGRMRPYDGETMKLQRIAVLKDQRGTGAGREIVLALEAKARELGYHHTILDAQVQAAAFYDKLGYTVTSAETFLDAGIPHVRMKKNISL
ncbi:GNAT family N-acetyltransferase [Paenibacillus thalictri]|nr:GNAT family N-acetyltransferase [Paenibacillus thalictri]